jgi:putative transposase
VASILAEAGIEPVPERNRKRTWKQFLRSHWETLCACDFFTVESLATFGTVRYLVFFVIELETRAQRPLARRSAEDRTSLITVNCRPPSA